MKKRFLRVMLCAVMAITMLAGCSGKGKETEIPKDKVTNEEKNTETAGKKPTIKVYGKVIEYTSGPMMTDALTEKLKDKYNIEAIQVDWANQDTVIRTGIASGEPCDIYNYEPGRMFNFADMAVDLKPYLDADPEWKAQFNESALEAGTIDGKILNVPWESNFSTILANKTKLDELGITIPESWTMDEFLEVCKSIKDSGAFPFANATDLGRAGWLYRNAMLSVVVGEGRYEDYIKGQVPLNESESKIALEATKILYDKGYMYPGEGAVTVKNDEIKAAFYQGDLLIMPEIAAGAKVTAAAADFEVVTVPWPAAGNTPAIHGVYNGFFIPKNCADIDAAVEVLKVLTSPEIQKIHADEGYIPANVKVEVTEPFVKTVVAQSKDLYSPEDPASVEMTDYRANYLLPELILGGSVDEVADKLESLRPQE
ncbi:MAG: ABC transporter substrate-binding protein [Anaerocolumna sp.]